MLDRPEIVPRGALIDLAGRYDPASEAAMLLRAVAAEPHRMLADPEVRHIHDGLTPLHRLVFLALLEGGGMPVSWRAIAVRAWGSIPPADPYHSTRQCIRKIRDALPDGWRCVCDHGSGYVVERLTNGRWRAP